MIKITDINVGDVIFKWRINKITNYNNSLVLEVILDSISPEKLITVFNYKTVWIMKIRDDVNEGLIYLKYKLNDCIFALDIPQEQEYFNSTFELLNNTNSYNTFTWYVTEKYDEDIGKNYKFAKNNWKDLLGSVIQFLKYIHQQKIIHGDIKARNILYKPDAEIIFKVCDYESLQTPRNDEICKDEGYNGFYYYSLGCNRDQPYFSYRMDLEAFGYILWAVLLSTEKAEYLFDWQVMAFDLYKKKVKNNSDLYYNYYNHLDVLKKNTSNQLMLYIIQKYFKIISIIDWKSIEPPDNSIYDKLLELQNYNENNDSDINIYDDSEDI
jgi:serine/threonine protein kinase